MIHSKDPVIMRLRHWARYDYHKIQYHHEALLTCPSESHIKPLYMLFVFGWLSWLQQRKVHVCLCLLGAKFKHCMENGQGEAWQRGGLGMARAKALLMTHQ